jgi:UDP-N-acetylglucosamine:LPS N-acetylglucosamine transferase
MIVLIVNEACSLGGAENMSIKLANSLIERNLQVYFIAAPGPLSKILDKNIPLFKINKFNILNMISIINDLSKIIKKIKPDIIHCQGATLSVLVGVALKKNKLKSINILTHHSNKFLRLPQSLSFYLLNKYCYYSE